VAGHRSQARSLCAEDAGGWDRVLINKDDDDLIDRVVVVVVVVVVVEAVDGLGQDRFVGMDDAIVDAIAIDST
jgi:hypothetical protein